MPDEIPELRKYVECFSPQDSDKKSPAIFFDR